MFLSLSPTLPLCLKINKIFKKKENDYGQKLNREACDRDSNRNWNCRARPHSYFSKDLTGCEGTSLTDIGED